MQNISPWFVLVLGMATVFIGLICLILLTKIMSAVMVKNKSAAPAAQEKAKVPVAQAAAVPAALNIGDRKLLDAILAASIACAHGDRAPGLAHPFHSLLVRSPCRGSRPSL